MGINEIIRNRRIEKGLSMKELAERLGVSEGTISRWESGKIEDMRRSRIKALSEVLGIPLYILMEWDEPSQKSEITDSKPDTVGWYQDPETAEIAQEIFQNPELKTLFDAAKDASPEDLKTVQTMMEALLRKERRED
jgi:transcriptional regulator with XRE-family HTH domain